MSYAISAFIMPSLLRALNIIALFCKNEGHNLMCTFTSIHSYRTLNWIVYNKQSCLSVLYISSGPLFDNTKDISLSLCQQVLFKTCHSSHLNFREIKYEICERSWTGFWIHDHSQISNKRSIEVLQWTVGNGVPVVN